MSTAAHEAAAAIAPGLAADLVNTMPLPGDDDALAADLQAIGAAAAPEQVPSSRPQTAPAAAQAPAPQAEEEFDDVDLEPVISDELRALLDEPDFEEEARVEVEAQIDDGDLEYSTDPEVVKKLRTLERRNAWLEEQRVVSDKKKWVAENLRAYPLLQRYAPDEVAAIDASSRRAFARQAASLNDRLAKMVKPALEEIVAAKKQLRGEVVQEVRGEYTSAWGDITTGPGVVPVEAAGEEAAVNAALRQGGQSGLLKAIGVMMRAAGVNQR